MITLRQLRYVEALCRYEHFGKAAEACAVTQPALSMQIQELEGLLGITLVERRRDGVYVTAEGRDVARRGQQILTEVRDLTDMAKAFGGLSGDLNIGVIPTIAPYILADILPILHDRYPNLRLRVRETLTSQLVQELDEGKLDLLLLALPVEQAKFEAAEVFEDPFVLAVPVAERSAYQSSIRQDELPNERMLLLEEGHCLRDQALNICALADAEKGEVFGMSSLSTLVQMVANNIGVTLLPELCLNVELRDERIAVVRFADPQPSRMIGVAWRKTSPCKESYMAFAEIIKESHRDLAKKWRRSETA